MATKVLTNKMITESFDGILENLSEKERSVIEQRVGLFWEKQTLHSIGSSFEPSITRERVRQIEETGIRKIGRMWKTSSLAKVQELSRKYIALHGWVISKEKLLNILIKDLNLDKDVNPNIIDILIQADFDINKSKHKLWCKVHFLSPGVEKETVKLIHNEALKILKKKKEVITKTSLYESISSNLKKDEDIPLVLIDSVLDLFEDIVFWEKNLVWLTKWKILNPKTIKDNAIYVMKKEKVPMHFVDLANKITETLGKSVKVSTIHNELIRNPEFVLIGRWIYALKEWGFKSWTVLDVIVKILEDNGWPMNVKQITKEVLKTRNVQESTVYMNLQSKSIIERVWRSFYQLKKD